MAKAGANQKKKGRKERKPVGTSWDSVRDKTLTYGKKGEQNRQRSTVKTAKTVKENISVNKTTEKKVKTKPNNYKGGSRSGSFTPTSTSTSATKRAGAKRAQDNKDLQNSFTTINSKVTTDYVDKNKTGGFNSTGKYDPSKHTAAENAYNKYRTVKGRTEKAFEKTVQVDSAEETRKKTGEIYKSNTKAEGNQLGQVYTALAKEAGSTYDKLVQEYGADLVKQQLGSRGDFIKSNYGTKDEYVAKGLKETEKDRHKSAASEAKGEGKYTFSKALPSSGDAELQRVASQFQNNQVKTKTDQDRYVTDKDGNIKYDISFDKDGNLQIKPKKKKGKEKIETTQGANIIDYYKGGFNEEGQLASQAGSQAIAQQRAGWIHDAPIMTGVLQGFGRADIKRGIGQYSDAAAKDVDKTTGSLPFMAGYMGGFMLQYPFSGVGKMTDALVGGTTRTILGMGTKGLERSAGRIGTLKGFTTMGVEAPMNTLDALKMSTDAKGNVDKKSLATWLTVNSLLSGGMGGVIGGVGSKMTKANAREYLALAAKYRATGGQLSEQELSRLSALDKRLENARNGNNLANSDIAHKADYDEHVMKQVFDKGGTPEEALKTINGGGTHVEKMNYAYSVRDEANAQFEQLRTQRELMLEQAKNMPEDEAAVLIREANSLNKEIDRLGEVINVAERELGIAEKRNRTAVQSLTKSLDKMSEKTGVNYRVVNDKDMRKIIAEQGEDVSDEYFYKGFYYKDENGKVNILINSESPQAHQTVIGHETGHLIKSANEEEFFNLGSRLEEYAKKKGDYDAIVEQLKKAYPTADEQELREEVICEMIGRYIYGADDKFIKQMAGENPTLMQRIVDYLRELLSKTEDKEMSKELQAIIDSYSKTLKAVKPKEGEVAPKASKFGIEGATGEQKELGIKAEQMFKDGEEPDKIFEETGWVVGTDGKAKMRFSDRDMTLNIKMKELKPAKSVADIQKASDAWGAAEDAFDAAVARNADDAELGRLLGNIQKAEEALEIAQNGVKEVSLGKLIDHEELFKRYPQLEDGVTVKFSTKKLIGGDGSTLKTGKDTWTVYINRNMSKDELMDTIVHETQHTIQDIEGFARGTSPEEWQGIAKGIKAEMDDIEKSLPSGVVFEKDSGGSWVIRDNKTGVMSSATKPENVSFDHFRGVSEKELRSKFSEWVSLKKDYDGMTAGFKNSPQATRDALSEQGKTQYFHTKGEWEARQAEAERNASDGLMKILEKEEASGAPSVTTMDKDGKFKTYELNDKNELKVEDYEKKYGDNKAANKMSREVAEPASNEKIPSDVSIKAGDQEYLGFKLKYEPSIRGEAKLNGDTISVSDEFFKADPKRQKNALAEQIADRTLKNLLDREGSSKLTERGIFGKYVTPEPPKDRPWAKEQPYFEDIFGKKTSIENAVYNSARLYITEPEYLKNSSIKAYKFMDNYYHEYGFVDEFKRKDFRYPSDDIKFSRDAVGKSSALQEEKKPSLSETAKMRESDNVSAELKSAMDEIEKVGIFKDKMEKSAKKYNELESKIRGERKHLANAEKSKKYKTETEREARIAEIKDTIDGLKDKQKKIYGDIQQMKKMQPADPNMTGQEQFKKLRGSSEIKTNKELKESTANLENENGRLRDALMSIRRLGESSLIEPETVAKEIKDKVLGQQLLDSTNRVYNSRAMANNWITNRRKSFNGKVGGKSADEIFEDVWKDAEKRADFQQFLIMQHVPARHAKGTDIYPEISPEIANKIVGELKAKYNTKVKVNGKEMTEIEAWAKDVHEYFEALQQYRVDSGLLSKADAEKFAKDYPFYVPTNRVGDDSVKFFTGGQSVMRSAEGGENEVLDMYSQAVTATMQTIHMAEENNMLNLYFRAKGVTKEQLKQAELPDIEHAVLSAEVNKKTGKATVSYFRDGVPVKFPCSSQLALGLRELDGLEFERLMKYAKMATIYGKPFKALITDWNLVFGVRNGAKDFQQALVNSKDTKFFGSSLGAAAHAIVDESSPYRMAYASMGGEHAQLVSYDDIARTMGLERDKDFVDKFLEKGQEFVDANITIGDKKIYNPVHYIEAINGGIEMMPRMSEFIGTLRKEADVMLRKQKSSLKELRKQIIKEVENDSKIGQSQKSAEVENRLAQKVLDMVGKDTLDRAMRNANDITLNFGRSGVITKAFNMGFVPYLNPSIQGLSKLARLFTEAGREGGAAALGSLGLKLGLFTIAPAAFNEFMLRDNENYQNINTRDKDNNFFIPLSLFGGDSSKFIKFPKPRENAVLAEPIEYAIRYAIDDAEYAIFDMGKLKTEGHVWEKIPLTSEGKQAFRTMIDNIGVVNPLTSNMLSPLGLTIANKTWYGGNIESAYETAKNEKTGKANVPVNKRYDAGTSAVAIWLGDSSVAKNLNMSPKKIDNLLDSYLGMIYDLGIAQTSDEAKARGNIFMRAVVGQFVKDSVFSNKLSTKAWDKIDGMTPAQEKEYKATYMYDTFKYDDAMDLIATDKKLSNKEKMEARRALMIKKNELNRQAIDGKPNTSNPLVDISEYLGATKTLNHFMPDAGDKDDKTWKDYWETYKASKGYGNLNKSQKEKASQKFLDVYSLGVTGQNIQDPTKFHDSPSWGMTGVSAAQLAKQGGIKKKEADSIMHSCGVWESETEVYHNYAKFGGTVKTYAVTEKRLGKTLDKLSDWGIDKKSALWKGGSYKSSKSMCAKGGTLAMSLATDKNVKFKDRAYYIANPDDPNMMLKMNAARGFASKYGHKTKEIPQLAIQADAMGDGNTYLKNDEIVNVCNEMKGTSEEKSMAYILLGGNPKKNPFGEIGNYSLNSDTGIQMLEDDDSKGGGKGGRGRRRRGGGKGKSSKGTMPSTDTGAFKGKATNPFSTSNGSKSSNLDDAYRKKVRKLREQLNK